MPDDLKWFKMQVGGKWYKTQAASVDEAKTKIGKASGPSPAAGAMDKYLASGQPTSVQREPGKGEPASFLTRTGKRVAEQLCPLGHPEEAGDALARQIHESLLGGQGFKEIGQHLAKLGPELKNYVTGDPAKIAGDVISGVIMGEALPGAEGGRGAKAGKVFAREVGDLPLAEEQQVKFTDSLDKANREHAQDLADYAEKESKRRAQWAEKTYGAKKSEANQIAASNKKAVLDRSANEYGKLAQQNISDVHQTVRERLDSRWNDFREKMSGAVDRKQDIAKIINDASEKLRGTPADLKQFKDLTRELGVEADVSGELADTGEAALHEEPTVPVETLRVHSSAIGERLAAGDLPGNVYQALKAAKEGIEGRIERLAESRNQGDIYRSLKRDWANYMSDWHDLRSIAGGKGSALARALRVPKPEFLQNLMMGKSGDLLLEDLGKYRDAGARPELARQTRVLSGKAKMIKAGVLRQMPQGYEPLPVPRLKEVTRPKPEILKRKAPMVARLLGRVGGKFVGGTVGAKLGHPLVGYGIGGELGEQAVEKVYQKKPGQQLKDIRRIQENYGSNPALPVGPE